MSFQVVHGEIWLPRSKRESFRKRGADHEGTSQARATRRRKRVDFADRKSSRFERSPEELRRLHEMITGSHLRHNSTVRLVLSGLGSDLARKQCCAAQNRDRRFVTGSFDRQQNGIGFYSRVHRARRKK